MTIPQTIRKLFVGSLLAATAAMIIAAGWLLWPVYLEHRALMRLEAAVADGDHRAFNEAVESLIRLRRGRAAIDALSDVMKTADAEIRYWSIRRIGAIAFERREVPPALIDATADTSRNVCLEATGSLQRLGELAVPALLDALASDIPRRRAGAADALGTIGPAALPARMKLIALTRDSEDRVREWSVWALSRIDPQAEDVVLAIIDVLSDSAETVRWEAGKAIRQCWPACVDLLLAALRSHAREQVRAGAANVLANHVGRSEEKRQALLDALKDSKANVRAAAADALGRVVLELGLNADGFAVRTADADAEPIPQLTAMLSDENARVRVAAAKALCIYGENSDVGLPVLIEAMKHAEDDSRYWAISALSEFGIAARDAVPQIIESLRDQDEDVRTVAARALGAIRADPEAVVPALVTALKDKSDYVRYFAATALGAFGSGAKQALPALRQALADADGGEHFSIDIERGGMRYAIDQINADAEQGSGTGDDGKDDR